MMMNNTLKNPFKFPPGTRIVGKWHNKPYVLVKELGYGANGTVYLAQGHNGYVALKMSENGVSITSEVNVLKAFSKAQGSALGPSILDVDDWEARGKRIPFYVMEYIKGPDLLTFINKRGFSWTGVLIIQLLNDLERIHQEGWVFGDLKPENLIITGPPNKIRCIDVGGTTLQGRAIKEFTEFFDRGYWVSGSRKAEPTYDLFSVAMIILNLAYPKRFNKTQGGYQQLKLAIESKKELIPYRETLFMALQGKFSSATEMRMKMLEVSTGNKNIRTRSTSQTVTASRQQLKKRKKSGGIMETILIIFIVAILYVLYIYGEIM
jgi:serine/threonine protein kinase